MSMLTSWLLDGGVEEAPDIFDYVLAEAPVGSVAPLVVAPASLAPPQRPHTMASSCVVGDLAHLEAVGGYLARGGYLTKGVFR